MIHKRTITLCLFAIMSILILCACNSNKNPASDTTSGSSSTAASSDASSSSISATNSDVSSESDKNAFLFELREKSSYTQDNSTGKVWRLYAFTNEAFATEFGDVDPSEIVGANSYIIGTDSDHVYLLVEPTDVQFSEDNPESQKQYEQLQKESQAVLSDFLKNNNITANEKCPKSACYRVDSN
jgi:hypothetical protein